MEPLNFPPVETADEHGLLCAGGDLSVAALLQAYSSGIFPWPHPPFPEILWFAPPQRAILEFKDFRLSRRDRRFFKQLSPSPLEGEGAGEGVKPFRFTVGKAFELVIRACAQTPRPGQRGTWLTEEMVRAYTRLHKAGYAQSFEVWNEKEELVGGLYGVLIKQYFSAESMFHHVSNASKFALLKAIDYLKSRGLAWLDIQVMTPHMRRHGARLIPRAQFMAKLAGAARFA